MYTAECGGGSVHCGILLEANVIRSNIPSITGISWGPRSDPQKEPPDLQLLPDSGLDLDSELQGKANINTTQHLISQPWHLKRKAEIVSALASAKNKHTPNCCYEKIIEPRASELSCQCSDHALSYGHQIYMNNQ